ncbi:CU044_2847 family protein [Micromonospora sp. NPDC023814]|uniref:CU044_2847 family protein n=1 Tax=Micromonospora sp. NPDC023814 TaxID=3154596 RepID=UPI0033E9645C
MQSEVVRYQVDDETVALIEVEPPAGFQPAGVGDVAGWVRESAASAVAAAKELLEQVKTVSPDAVEVKFGVKATGTASWVVAKATGEANFEVTLHWHAAGSPEIGTRTQR